MGVSPVTLGGSQSMSYTADEKKFNEEKKALLTLLKPYIKSPSVKAAFDEISTSVAYPTLISVSLMLTSNEGVDPKLKQILLGNIDHIKISLSQVANQMNSETNKAGKGIFGDYYSCPPSATDGLKKDLAKDANRAPEVLASLGPKGQELLYAGCPEVETTYARDLFLGFYQKRLQELPQHSKLQKNPTTMEKLLGNEPLKEYGGKTGIELYRAAIEEEGKSRAFRGAVFVKATQHYEGQTWDEPKTFVIGGASATGKSFCTEQLVNHISSETPNDPSKAKVGNDVVAVDGGIERELSQIRQLVLQEALAKGEKGIKDLHKESKGISVKKHIKKAALNANKSIDPNNPTKVHKFSLAIPMTFASPVNRFIKNKILDKVPGREAIYAYVKADKKQTEVGGNNRAWASKLFDKANSFLNNRKIGCESKVYQSKYFDTGVAGSVAQMNDAKKSGCRCYEINNELVYLKEVVNNDGKKSWVPCEANDAPDHFMSFVAFNKWKEAGEPSDIKKWTNDYLKGPPPVPLVAITKTSGPKEVKSETQTLSQTPMTSPEIKPWLKVEPKERPKSMGVPVLPPISDDIISGFSAKSGRSQTWQVSKPSTTELTNVNAPDDKSIPVKAITNDHQQGSEDKENSIPNVPNVSPSLLRAFENRRETDRESNKIETERRLTESTPVQPTITRLKK